MEKDDLSLLQEFFNLPWSDCDIDLCTEGMKDTNVHKNRYSNIIAPDSTRVKLRGGDYINANYIDIGPFSEDISPKKVIACQGPLKTTEHDFWTMVLENRCPLILMLTDCIENKREKCSNYWPTKKDSRTFFSFDGYPITVEKTGEDEVHDYRYIVSNLVVTTKGERLDLKHIHYLGWKDGKTPDPEDIDDIIAFVNKVWVGGGEETPSPQPIVCHCSAGIGRTGVMVTILRCIETGESVSDALIAIRECRHGMIQTPVQYDFTLRFVASKRLY